MGREKKEIESCSRGEDRHRDDDFSAARGLPGFETWKNKVEAREEASRGEEIKKLVLWDG